MENQKLIYKDYEIKITFDNNHIAKEGWFTVSDNFANHGFMSLKEAKHYIDIITEN